MDERADNWVSGLVFRDEETGRVAFDVVPVDEERKMHPDGTLLCFSQWRPDEPEEPNWFNSTCSMTLGRKAVEDLRDALTDWLEGKWAGIGIKCLPTFPAEGLPSLDSPNPPS